MPERQQWDPNIPNQKRPTTENANKVKTPKEELHTLWRELVQNQRVHEMVKCLQAEKKKLKVLHSNLEGNDDFLNFAARQFAAKFESKGRKSDAKSQSGGVDDANARKGSSGKEAEEDARSQDTATRPTGHLRGSSSPRLERSPSSSSRSFRHSRGVRNAAEMMSNKAAITDQDFEDIVELCEDKVEQKALREAFEEKKNREKYLLKADEQRNMLYNFINSQFFTNFMLLTIITSIVGIFLLTFESIAIRYAFPLIMLDSCIIGIFLVEAIVKVTIYTGDYFKQLWNLLDMLIIIVHFVEVAVDLVTRTLASSTDLNSSIGFKFLKSLRALRLLRVIKFLPNLQVIVATVFQSMLSIGSIAVLMFIFLFVFAVMGRGLFYEKLPNKFGSLWVSHVTLFQLLTLDDWFELLESEDSTGDMNEYDGLTEEKDTTLYWFMFLYLFAYLVIEFFVFLNLFVAVLVDNFQLNLADAEIQKQREQQEEIEAQKKFEDMKNEGMDPTMAEEEHQRHKSELEQLGMYVEDYFPVDKDSREADLLSEFFKDLNSLDFERFMWRRRQTLFNIITDTALASRQNASIVQESASSSSSSEDEFEAKEQGPRKSLFRKSKMEPVELTDSEKSRISKVKQEYLPSRYTLQEEDGN